jgi:hypothetical protein
MTLENRSHKLHKKPYPKRENYSTVVVGEKTQLKVVVPHGKYPRLIQVTPTVYVVKLFKVE